MPAIAKDLLPAIIERLKSNTSSLGQEARALGMSYRTTLITALRDFMGREKYDEMMSGRRPHERAPGSAVVQVRPDDSEARRVDGMRRSEGWSFRRVAEHAPIPRTVVITQGGKQQGSFTVMDTGRAVLVARSPEGIEYTYADANERADLLMRDSISGGFLRFVEWERSAHNAKTARHTKQAKAELARGEAALERKRAKPSAAVASAKKNGKRVKRKA